MPADELLLEKPVAARRTTTAPVPIAQPPDPAAQMQKLTDSVDSIAKLLQAIAEPLQLYLEDNISGSKSVAQTSGLFDQVLAESPIAPFLADDEISDILINGPHEIYISRRDNQLEKTEVSFSSSQSLAVLARTIAGFCGRTIDPKRPLIDARLKDGSRVNIIAPPMAVGGLTISIRKFPHQEITLDYLVEHGEMSQQVAAFFKLCAQSRVSILISGGTGTGKTTLLNAISRYIPKTERIITIEDTAELRLQQPHVVQLETKEPAVAGQRNEEVSASDLLKNALRMRPDRIIVGEVRGEEAFDMVQALNTGHDGSMSTVHANTPRDAFTRIENLMGARMLNTPAEHIRHQMVSALNFIIQLMYDQHGNRRVANVTEIVGMEGEMPTMQEIFTLHTAPGEHGHMHYQQLWTGIIPRHPRLAEAIKSSALFQSGLHALARDI